MDLDHALRIDPPVPLTDASTSDQKRTYEHWERSKSMSLMIIKNSISFVIRGAIPDPQNAKEYFSFVDEQFKGTSKAHASTLILKMMTTKYDRASRKHLYFMSVTDFTFKSIGDLCLGLGSYFELLRLLLPSEISTANFIVDTFILSFWMMVLPNMTLYLDVDLTIWNCNMIVLDSGYDLTMSARLTTPSG
ncbi:hypothetical protein Tco_1562332 [Tanacetum coccineum]